MTDDVTYSVDDHIAWIRLNRPDALNALNTQARVTLGRHLSSFEEDERARVLIITGTGDRAFSAGADVKELAAQDDPDPAKQYLPIIGRNITITKPTIAAVNGLAYGAGFLIVQMCDLCVAADTAVFAIPEAKIARGAPWAAPLPWLIPPRVALEMLMTGDPLTAQRAYEIGLVNRVVARSDLEAEALKLGVRIAGNAPLTVKSAKTAVYSSNWQSDSMYDRTDRIWAAVYASPDAIEGPRAFREARLPRWSER